MVDISVPIWVQYSSQNFLKIGMKIIIVLGGMSKPTIWLLCFCFCLKKIFFSIFLNFRILGRMSSENEKSKEKEEKTKPTPDTNTPTTTTERRSRRQARSETESSDKPKEKSKTAVSIFAFLEGLGSKFCKNFFWLPNQAKILLELRLEISWI